MCGASKSRIQGLVRFSNIVPDIITERLQEEFLPLEGCGHEETFIKSHEKTAWSSTWSKSLGQDVLVHLERQQRPRHHAFIPPLERLLRGWYVPPQIYGLESIGSTKERALYSTSLPRTYMSTRYTWVMCVLYVK